MTFQLPPVPKERDYPETPEGAKDYARDFGEWIRQLVDVRNKHRQAAIDQLAQAVLENTADLERGDRRPGWVQVQIALLRADNQALLADNKRIRGYLKTAIFTSFSALLSLGAMLGAQLLER